MENFIDLEQQLNKNIDLLKIAKDYCEFNQDKGSTVSALMSLIEIILQNEKDLISNVERAIA